MSTMSTSQAASQAALVPNPDNTNSNSRRRRRRSSASHIQVGSYTRSFKPSIDDYDIEDTETESITSMQVRDQAAGLSSMAFDYDTCITEEEEEEEVEEEGQELIDEAEPCEDDIQDGMATVIRHRKYSDRPYTDASPSDEYDETYNGGRTAGGRGRRGGTLPAVGIDSQDTSSSFSGSSTKPRWMNKPQGLFNELTRCIPAVFIGLLLNILDALSYGMILFPLSIPTFAHLGPAGLSMFYVSCIVAQLTYSLGGSKFKSGVGSEMIEVVPFFHSMAFSILNIIGENDPESVIATTIFSFALSSMATGIVFFVLGLTNLGALVGFFPRHILVGCIGGVGWFLLATGLEVSAQLDESSKFSMDVLKYLFAPTTLPKWTIPLVLAILLMLLQRRFNSPIILPAYFIAIFIAFHTIVAFLPVTLTDVREAGYLFSVPDSNEPWYEFYKLYKLSKVNLAALLKTIPAMLALTFFGLLHVPINVPALAIATEDDHSDVNRELLAHGISNFVSGALGSIQNYLVYTNSLFFIKSGADSRIAGVLLAAATFGTMLAGPGIIGVIPIMLVAALIFLLGFELVLEALETWPHVSAFEYATILTIIIIMGVKDFVFGILVGIILACVSFVIQASRTSAIKAQYTGQAARSNVRRHYMQHKFLTQVSSQTYVIKLAGYLFFGTVVNVESTIRSLIDESNFGKHPIRFLVVDLTDVTALDYSAAEAFVRIKRLLDQKHVHLLLSGQNRHNMHISFDKSADDPVFVFPNVNTALEWSENEQLRGYYSQKRRLTQENLPTDPTDPADLMESRNTLMHYGQQHINISMNMPNSSSQRPLQGIPQAKGIPKGYINDMYLSGPVSGSPRSRLFQKAVRSTVEEDQHTTEQFRNMQRPLAVFHQIFQGVTEKDDEFWKLLIPYFERIELPPGAVLFVARMSETAFYLVEKGILRADYDFQLGHIYESILPGTTCGELPFFSASTAAATVVVEAKATLWKLSSSSWDELKKAHPEVANDVLTIVLKLAAERFKSIAESALVG